MVLVPAMTRHYAAGDMPGLTALWKRAIRRTSLVLFPTFVFFMLTAEETVRILYGAAYHESAVVFRIYLCLVPLRVATYGIITQAIGKTRVNLSARSSSLPSTRSWCWRWWAPSGFPALRWRPCWRRSQWPGTT